MVFSSARDRDRLCWGELAVLEIEIGCVEGS